MKLKELIDRIVADGVITPDEHQEIVDLVCADPDVSLEERNELGRLRELIDSGAVRFTAESAPGEE
jgi:hypothetical protein